MVEALDALQVDGRVLRQVGAVVILLWAMIGYETFFVYDERRYRLRHGLEIDVSGGTEAIEKRPGQ